MPDDRDMLKEMDFEKRLNDFGDNQLELLKFVARQQYQTMKLCPMHDSRINKLERTNKKVLVSVGGAGTFVGGLIIGVIEYFRIR